MNQILRNYRKQLKIIKKNKKKCPNQKSKLVNLKLKMKQIKLKLMTKFQLLIIQMLLFNQKIKQLKNYKNN